MFNLPSLTINDTNGVAYGYHWGLLFYIYKNMIQIIYLFDSESLQY